MMNTHQKAIRSSLVFLAVALLSTAPVILAAQSAKDSEEVSGLLAEAKTESLQLKQDAEELNSFVRSKTSWQTHASKLNEIKQHANKLGELVAKMNNAKSTASPWQQQSIDRITPLLRELAAGVTSTIKHLSDNQNRLQHPPFPEYAATNADLASDLSQLISDYVAYGEARHKSDDLAQKLEVPGA
jgi:hypothetical protein